jgi:bifunctional non-homologous end joining protein LigD
MSEHDYVPQLATLVAMPPAGDEWLHEIKLDGYRIGCRVHDGRVTLISRSGKDWTASFPEIADEALALPVGDALLDGEVAAVLPDGRTSFQTLQHALSGDRSVGTLVYFAFDLLRLDNERLDALPLEERKARLQEMLAAAPTGRIRYTQHVTGHGPAFFEQACRLGLEGIVSKQRSLPYHPGRHKGWLKIKCVRRQEFVIGGFTDPEGTRAGLGALLIGCYERKRLVFCGRVGTGFTHAVTIELRRRLDGLERSSCPFDPPPSGPLARRAHWVRPVLVCEVGFTEWTAEGKVRHPRFYGLREDTMAREVRRERPFTAPPAPRPRGRRLAEPSGLAGSTPLRKRRAGDAAEVAGIRISNPTRTLYADPPTTKLDLATYYERIAEWIVPHVAGRPLTLVRCPTGLSGRCFYMKHSNVRAPAPLRRVPIQERAKTGEYLIADDAAALAALVQMGILEIHTWNSVFDALERPNRLVIDLDPGELVAWPQVVRTAILVRAALGALGLESYVKTTGGRGLHVVAPLLPKAGWTECLAFSRMLSERIAATDPGALTTQFSKRGRADKILIDYLRNNRGSTSIAAFSTRARAGAPVSVPVSWDELRTMRDPPTFNVATVPQRLERQKRDPWKSYWSSRQRLTSQHLRAVEVGR